METIKLLKITETTDPNGVFANELYAAYEGRMRQVRDDLTRLMSGDGKDGTTSSEEETP